MNFKLDNFLNPKKLRLIALIFPLITFIGVFFNSDIYKNLSLLQNSDATAVFIISAAALVLCMLFLYYYGDFKSDLSFLAAIFIATFAIIMRLFMFDSQSGDYNSFLSEWIFEMRTLPGVEALVKPIGDYNMPYLYFLFVIAKSGIRDLYMIKIISVIFDLVCALGVLKLVSVFNNGDNSKLFAFTIFLFAPTVFLNSSYWAQCDSVYTAFCIFALYFALKDKGSLSVIFFSLAFSFKIQTIFILPIIVFLLILKKIKPLDLVLFPVTFVLTLVPALICGRSFYDTFSIYLSQTQSYPSLSMNAASFWEIFPESEFMFFGSAAVFFAGAGALLVLIALLNKYKKIEKKHILDIALIFCLLIPFLLPRMHERYFYLAEVLSIIYVIVKNKRLYIAPILLTTGFVSYYPFIFGEPPISFNYLPIANGIVLIILIKALFDDLNKNSKPLLKGENI